MDGLFMEPTATEMANRREVARSRRRIIYDCYNAVVFGGSVKCKAGHSFASRLNWIPLAKVLRGSAYLRCQGCKDYIDGEDNAIR